MWELLAQKTNWNSFFLALHAVFYEVIQYNPTTKNLDLSKLCTDCLGSQFWLMLAPQTIVVISKIKRTFLSILQGPVVRRRISADPRLNFNLGLFFFCSKAFSRIIFSILFRASNHQIVGKKNKTDFLFKLSYLSSNFALTLSYLNPALNNTAQEHYF